MRVSMNAGTLKDNDYVQEGMQQLLDVYLVMTSVIPVSLIFLLYPLNAIAHYDVSPHQATPTNDDIGARWP